MIKILYLVSSLANTGPTNQLSYIVKNLDRELFHPTIIALSHHKGESEFIDNIDADIKIIGFSRVNGLFKNLKTINSYILNNKIDIVHSQGIRSDVIAASVGIPTVSTLRNYPFYDYSMEYGVIVGYFIAKFHLKILKKINHPVVVSRSISDLLLRKHNYKIPFVLNGIDKNRFKLVKNLDLLSELQPNPAGRIFTVIGDLSFRKNPLPIIDAFKKSSSVEGDVLIFLGGGPLTDKCVRLTAGYRSIKVLGNVGDVVQYLLISDYLISSSLAEGMPNAVLEACAANVPLILSDIDPHVEIYNMAKENTLLFSNSKLENLVQVFDDIATDNPNIKLKRDCSEVVSKYLDAKIMSNNYQKIYIDLL